MFYALHKWLPSSRRYLGLNYYQELIGVLRWRIELVRVDILLEVSLLSCHLSLPRSGHLQQLYHIFGYLKYSPRRRLFFDPDPPSITKDRFQKFDWLDFYKGFKEDIPIDMPEPRGNAFGNTLFPCIREITTQIPNGDIDFY